MKVITKWYLGFVLQLSDASSMQTVHDIDNITQSQPIFFRIPEENDDEENNIIYTHIQK